MIREPLPSTHRSIGAILVDSGRISPENASRAITLQKEGGLRFGDAAMRLGLVTEQDVQFALSQQFDYTYLPLTGAERPVSEELIAAYQPFNQQVEALRTLRTQLLLRWFDKSREQNALAVVSSQRGEGRSHLAANLAVVFSQLGQRTLLIDADLRTPRQHALFNLDNKAGLSSLLAGWSGADAFSEIDCLANLTVLPAGPVPPNPLEMLNRPSFAGLLDEVRSRFDVVLVDTPAAVSGADVELIASRTKAALGVARQHMTRRLAFKALTRSLMQAGATVVGSVLNEAPVSPGK